MRKTLIGLALIACLGFTAAAGPATPTSAATPQFVGHNCTIATCRYFTSSYSTAIYFYDRQTCDQWKSLSRTYLRGFRTKTALLSHYKRKLHAPC